MSNWDEAADRYRQNSLEIRLKNEEQELAEAVKGLEAFLNSIEGISARNLLTACEQSIIMASEEHDGTGCAYLFNQHGLQFSSAPAGLSAAYAKERISPSVKPLITIEFVRSVSRCGKKPAEILPFIRSELDRIASAAP
jgi:hypothetical protein